MNIHASIVLSVIISTPAAANIRCVGDSSSVNVPKFHIMEKCHRSKMGIAAKANYNSVVSCHRLAVEKKALAVNFSPPEATKDGDKTLDYSCEVLKCAEADGGLSLENDTRYDYYSIYARPIPNVNSTCVPAIGMFYLLPKRHNFTQAMTECKNISGVLADITNEQRTDALAQMLNGAGVDAALVGLKRVNESGFRGLTGDPLDCSTFRAWEPGHPRRFFNKFDCVLLTRHKTWRSISCKKKHPVLCQLLPGGPYKRGSIFPPQSVNDTQIKEISKEKIQQSP